MEPGYDSSDDKDSNDKPDEPPGRPRPSLIRRSDDDDDTIIVEDVLEDDELLEDFEEEADVIQEPRGRGCKLEHLLSLIKQALEVNHTWEVRSSKCQSTTMR